MTPVFWANYDVRRVKEISNYFRHSIENCFKTLRASNLLSSCNFYPQCRGINCQPGSSSLEQRVEVVSSVGFVDVSNRPEPLVKPVPTFEAKAASDFFFPFF